jgi:CubicO group peptidase (beta-lactamase class C family)
MGESVMTIERRLDAVAQRAIAENRIVGTVLVVRKDGDVLYEKAHGLADREAGRAMTLDTIFRLSSLTKPIIAATILALHDAGHVRVGDPVTEYLPWFRPKLPDGREPVITLSHLLTHTAGLPGNAPDWTEAEKVDPRYLAVGFNRFHLSLEENVRRLVQEPLLFEPGTAWTYSQATDVLGLIAATAESPDGVLGEVVESWVTGPLGMVDTGFKLTDPSRLAAAYGDGFPQPVLMSDDHGISNAFGGTTRFFPSRIFDTRNYHQGGGGMAGTGPDFVKLLEALNTSGVPILMSSTARDGLNNQTPGIAYSQMPGWKFSHFGAWLDDPDLAKSPAARGTTRWGGIFGHNWFIDPENGLSVVSMSNTGLEGCDGDYKEQVRDAVYASL